MKKNRLSEMTTPQYFILFILGFLCIIVLSVGGFLIINDLRSQQSSKISISPTSTSPSQGSSNKNVVGVWEDDWVLPCTITIEKINGSYKMTRLYKDGSKDSKILSVQVVNGVERLIEYPNSPAGDYMIIRNNGNLAFYDNEGLIYEDFPK
jgi:hypothetical protein